MRPLTQRGSPSGCSHTWPRHGRCSESAHGPDSKGRLSSRILGELCRTPVLAVFLIHTALSHYAEVLTVAEVQTIAGHSNSQTTDKYIHVDREQMKQKLRVNSQRFN